MDERFQPTAQDAEREVALMLYPAGTDFAAVRNGTASGAVDLAPYASRIEQRPDQLTLTLAWHLELYSVAEPQPGRLVSVQLDGVLLWLGLIESRHEYRIEPGTRTMSLTARRRDATPKWRSVRRVTDLYPMGTSLDTILRDVAASLGIEGDAVQLPPMGYAVAQSNLQLADMTGWEMLESLMLPAGFSPFVDGQGRLRAMSREIAQRAADVSLAAGRIAAVTGSRARPAVSALRLKWLDPNLTEVAQAERALASANITAGFFQVRQQQAVYWSDDRTQRARGTHLIVKQSANSGLIKVCDEDYRETAHTGGKVVLETASWVPGLIGVFVAVKAAGALPDIAPPFGGPTTPIGKMVHAALELSVLLVMASIGTGSYEIWGTPYDYVHARNTTEAFDAAAAEWAEAVEELSSDLILSEPHAQAVAARELIYRVRSASAYGVTIVDDPRIEPGDLMRLPDGSRLYVTGYRRLLHRDAPAVLEVEGFQA